MADTQLFDARREFVDRVSKDVIVQLLDDLLEDRGYKRWRKGAVIEDNRSRAKWRAISLILCERKGQ
uniref:Uncharacterized protein n=1 Tax=Anguilla anguilla TaxID=7936 RepID=A0A0E9XE86_ANGAN